MADYGDPLTEREKQLVQLVATGVTNRQVAQHLHISVNTVKVHLRNIFIKLGAESRTEATVIAARERFIELDFAGGLASSAALPLTATSADTVTLVPLPWGKRIALMAAAVLVMAIVAVTWPKHRLPTGGGANPPQDVPPESALPIRANDSPWTELAQMPTRRAYLALAAAGNQLVAIGGRTAESSTAAAEIYDVSNNIWHRTTDKPSPVAYVSAAAIGDDIYVPGGRDAESNPTDILEVFNITTESWQEACPLPEPRYAYAITTLSDRFYLFGGWDGKRYVASVYSYSPQTDTWTEEPPMQTPRGFASAASLNGQLYVVGGYDGSRELTTCESYDPQTGKWTSCPSLNVGRGGLGLVSVGQQLFAVGGGGWTSYLGFNEKYDPVNRAWTVIETPIVGEWRSPGVAAIQNTIYAVGGWSNGPLAMTQAFAALPFRVFIPISSSDSGEK